MAIDYQETLKSLWCSRGFLAGFCPPLKPPTARSFLKVLKPRVTFEKLEKQQTNNKHSKQLQEMEGDLGLEGSGASFRMTIEFQKVNTCVSQAFPPTPPQWYLAPPMWVGVGWGSAGSFLPTIQKTAKPISPVHIFLFREHQ